MKAALGSPWIGVDRRPTCVIAFVDLKNEIAVVLAAVCRSVFGPMRNRPLPRMLDGSVRRQRGAKLSHRRMCLHPLPPSAEGRVFRIHAPSFLRQSERVRARQDVEVGQSRIGRASCRERV